MDWNCPTCYFVWLRGTHPLCKNDHHDQQNQTHKNQWKQRQGYLGFTFRLKILCNYNESVNSESFSTELARVFEPRCLPVNQPGCWVKSRMGQQWRELGNETVETLRRLIWRTKHELTAISCEVNSLWMTKWQENRAWKRKSWECSCQRCINISCC